MWLGIGKFASFALAIVSAAILSRYLEKGEYGTYRQIIYVYNTLLVVFSAGLPNVFSYFLPRYSLEQGKEIVRKLMTALFLLGFIFGSALFLLSGPIARVLGNPELSHGLKLFSVIPFLLLPTLGLDGIFSTYKKTQYIPLYYIITRTCTLLFIVLPVVFIKASYVYAIYGWIIVSFLSLILAFLFRRIVFGGIRPVASKLNYSAIFKYSLPVALASIWGIAIKSADQFYISRFFGTEVFAEYANGFIELPFVTMVTYATSNVVLPIFSKMSKDGERVEGVMGLWNSAIRKSALIIYPLVLFFIFYGRDIVVFLYSSSYEGSAIFFQIAMFVNFFNIILFAPLMFSIGKTRLYARIHMFFAIAVWALAFAVVQIFNSPVALAINSVSLAIIKVIVFVVFLTRHFKVRIKRFIPLGFIGRLIIHSLLVVGITRLGVITIMPDSSRIMVLMAGSLAFGSLLLLSSRFFKLDYLQLLDPVKRAWSARMK